MRLKSLLLLVGLVMSGALTLSAKVNKKPAPWERETKMEAFVDSLLQKMTLEEKLGQLTLFSSSWDITGPITNNNYVEDVKKGKVGAIFNAYSADFTYRLQKENMENTRLSIPLLFGYDVIHGHWTTFPIPLAEACSWDLEWIEKSARIAAIEATSEGLHWTFAPMVDIARDPRWGRIAEGAGEDIFLGCEIAKARVHGFQGDDLSQTNTMLACAKHYAAYGVAQAGRDYHTVDISNRELWGTYMPPFKAALNAGVATFMTSFNELDGTPCTGNEYLLDDVLRKKWHFDGFVVTDYTSIMEMTEHGNVKDEKEAGEVAINAGVDMDMQSGIFNDYLPTSVEEGKVLTSRINEAVRQILKMKYRLGLFEDPYKYSDVKRAKKTLMKPEFIKASRELAKRSIVLLKNEDQILPLDKNIKKLALIGPYVKNRRDLVGTWSGAGKWEKAVTVMEGVEKAVSRKTEILYAEGCKLFGDDRSGFDNAVATAKEADAVVLMVGEPHDWSGEAASRTDLELPGVQPELVKEIMKTGKPVVMVMMNGRPLTIDWEAANVPAIVEAWHLGVQAGPAVADVLFGDYNPSAKLTVTFPRNVGQIPIYYNMKHTGRPMDPNQKFTSKYLDCPNSPLYPFGYGLSYTTFDYSAVELDKTTMGANDQIIAKVKVSNTGKYDGEEVVQLYIQDLVGSVTRPVKELKGFKKVFIPKGESVEVEFTITAEDLAFYRKDMSYGVEKGDFKVFIGTNSQEVQESQFTLTQTAPIAEK
ncbi:glycoside hydrolase family 3 N-terminal domain-containing protein [Marinifilum sp. D737]|uniref:glycoside hydrolase family 3 N-terminal domain-containing protein n=1 Tax=Marinifilum sp. D737 TaxID=2969628 RepID=UPI002274C445|nr:glycoside hydrolase family 3 N-terminal domain-containing protein [Marinifilum sp. D737]MCY1633744.1 glycoside hydrolase family 3 C-terminal domain-containing protein [Marinifilum sp. D737]